MKSYLLPAALTVVAAMALILVLFGTAGPLVPSREPPAEKAPLAAPSRSAVTSEPAIVDSSDMVNSSKAVNSMSILPNGSESAQAPAETVMDAIDDAAYSSSPDALPFIAQQLNHADPEVREAAVDGIKILSDPAAIPVLRKAASRARNQREREQLLEAAEWLALPDWVPPERGKQ